MLVVVVSTKDGAGVIFNRLHNRFQPTEVVVTLVAFVRLYNRLGWMGRLLDIVSYNPITPGSEWPMWRMVSGMTTGCSYTGTPAADTFSSTGAGTVTGLGSMSQLNCWMKVRTVQVGGDEVSGKNSLHLKGKFEARIWRKDS